MAYGVDRHLWPMPIGGETIVWDENGTTESASLGTGPFYYYKTRSAGDVPSRFSAFVDELQATLNSTGDTNFTVTSQTPLGSSLTESGLRVENSNITWNWLFSSGSFSLDPRYLGYGENPNDPLPANNIDSRHSVRGKWQSWALAQQNSAVDKRDDKEYPQTASHDEVEEAFILQHGGRRHTRGFQYDDVPAAHVKEFRGADGDYASFGSLSTGDFNNTIYDLWEHSHKGEEVLVVHDGGDAPDFAEPVSGRFEAYRIDDPEQRSAVSSWYQTESRAGEIYNLIWDTVITEGQRGPYVGV